MSNSLSVAEIWRYPVKSVGGERLSSAVVTSTGIEGDRGWGLFDVATGNVLTARRAPDLLMASASVGEDGNVSMHLPDGTVTSDNGELSAWLGREVELHKAGDEGGTYEVPLDFENDDNWVSWQGPADAWHDSTKSRVSLVSRTSLRSWDQRRFRTNLILDGSGEDDLVGSSIGVGGDVQLNVTKQIDRCVIVTRPQPGLERDLDVLRTINKERASMLSIGALVDITGTIAEGDAIAAVSS